NRAAIVIRLHKMLAAQRKTIRKGRERCFGPGKAAKAPVLSKDQRGTSAAFFRYAQKSRGRQAKPEPCPEPAGGRFGRPLIFHGGEATITERLACANKNSADIYSAF
ncbi:MAG: hypothetical protein II189_07160, partial [Lachnospiraceae bacterium]|nr:hypothetical protein [Lachnospiraceae bacterium]